MSRAMRYPAPYTWLVFLASMDIMLTWIVLHGGGNEVNSLAAWVIRIAGLPGMVIYKFALVLVIIGVCEVIARRKEPTARKLAEWAVAITAVPVVITLVLLMAKRMAAA